MLKIIQKKTGRIQTVFIPRDNVYINGAMPAEFFQSFDGVQAGFNLPPFSGSQIGHLPIHTILRSTGNVRRYHN